MKMVKKILLGMAFTAAVLSFVSCGVKQDEEKAFDGENIDFTHDGTSGNYYRSFASTKTKHFSANAKITIEDADTIVTKSGVVSKAGFGFVFGLEDVTGNYDVKDSEGNKVTFYDFGIASVRWDAVNNKAQWYVSWCKNVPDTVFNYNNNTGFEDSTLVGTAPQASEAEIVKGDATAWKDLSALKLVEGNLKAVIKTVANDDGSYKVMLFDNEENKMGEATISKAVTGLNEKTQKLIGRYITVYNGQSVKGTIEYEDISGNVIPADYDVVIE